MKRTIKEKLELAQIEAYEKAKKIALKEASYAADKVNDGSNSEAVKNYYGSKVVCAVKISMEIDELIKKV